MEVTIIKQPFAKCFSGSPVNFSFGITPYRLNDRNINIRLQVTLLIEKNYRSNIFEEEYTETKYPNELGRVDVEVQSLLDPFLQYFLPDFNANAPETATGQFLRFKLKYLLLKDADNIVDTGETSVYNCLKGGISYPMYSPVQFFQSMISEQYFLGIDHTAINTFTEQKQFLYFLVHTDNPYGALFINSYELLFTVTAGNGLTYTKSIVPDERYYAGTIICLPSGYTQQNLQDILPVGELPVSYTVELKQTIGSIGDIETTTLAIANYTIEHRAFYNTKQLFYYNSAGGLNTLVLRGEIEFAAEYEKQNAERIQLPDYFRNNVPEALSLVMKPEETQVSKGATGFISKSEAEQLRDIFLSENVYELKYGKLIPVIINSRNVKFYANRDSLISLQIEWQDAFRSPYFTKENAVVAPNYCPGVESFSVIQYSKDRLQISYALEMPYDLAEITIIINTDEYVYQYRGNVNVLLQEFINPLADTDPPLSIEVKIRTICDLYSDPQSFSAYTTATLDIAYELLPVANNDVFEVPGGLTAPLQLQDSILQNDYDPDGDPIEAVVATAQPTAQGGTVSIDADGIVTYEPPTALFVGQDYYDYDMRNVGSATTVTARIYFNVRQTVVNVYAKVVLKNVKYESQFQNILGIKVKIGNYTTADVYIEFYSDPLGTVPLDVKGLALDIDYRRTRTNESPTPGVVTNDYTFNTGDTFLRSKTRHAISTQEIIAYHVTTDIPGVTKLKWYVNYNLLAGTGYIII